MTPKAILTGSAGGTVITIRSKTFKNRSTGYTTSLNLAIIPQYVIIAIANKKNKNLEDYLWKIFSCSLGNKIILINCPFIVTKFVLVTQTGIPNSSLYF